MIGQVLGHCRVVAKIGDGGMGVVYRAYDELLHRDVALKVVNKGARIDSSASQRLLNEARASSSLAHPNICTIHEVGEANGELYIVMELVEGKSLRAMSARCGIVPGICSEVRCADCQCEEASPHFRQALVLYQKRPQRRDW